MSGCRGDPAVLEKKIWENIKVRRAAKDAAEPDAAANDRAAELLAEAKRLRELARELLEKARELEEAAGR